MSQFTFRRKLWLSLLLLLKSLLLLWLKLPGKLILLLELLLLLDKLLLLRLLGAGSGDWLSSSGIKLCLEPGIRPGRALLLLLGLKVVLPGDESGLRSGGLLKSGGSSLLEILLELLKLLLELLWLLLELLRLLLELLLLLLESRLSLEGLLLGESLLLLLLSLELSSLFLQLLLPSLFLNLLLSEPLSLLLCLDLSLFLSLSSSFLLKFSGDYLGQSVRVKGDEHVEGMLEDVISQVVELVGTKSLQLRAQGSELLVELRLFLS